MPIFEYQCLKCNSSYEIFHKSLSNQEKVECPNCGSTEHKKLLSSFSSSMNSTVSSSSCASGNCSVPAPSYGGCSTGMCGLN